MAVDPLSSATRTAKRNLLIVSTLAITYRAFDISIDKIPFAGLSITFNSGVFAFLLTAALLYFSLTFALYYYIDIQNMEETLFESRTFESYKGALTASAEAAETRCLNDIAKTLNIPVRDEATPLALSSEFNPIRNQRHLVALFGIIATDPSASLPPFGCRDLLLTDMTPSGDVKPKDFGGDPVLASELDKVLAEHFSRFRKEARRTLIQLFWRKWVKLVIYPFRNYVVDGLLPVAIAALAFAALYNIVDLHWLRIIAPDH